MMIEKGGLIDEQGGQRTHCETHRGEHEETKRPGGKKSIGGRVTSCTKRGHEAGKRKNPVCMKGTPL